MKHVIIVDSHGVELQRHPLNGDDHYNETLVYGCMITAESQSMEHPENPRKSSVVDDEAE
jgi:hypothetical protein